MYWLSGFTRRKKITVYQGHLDADIASFPVCVKIVDDTDMGAVCRSNGYDVRFCASDGYTPLKFGCETFVIVDNKASAVYWVSVDLTKPDTHFYMYYGNPTAGDATDQEMVWKGYHAVWHLKQTGLNILDSTSHHYNGVKGDGSEPAEVLGKIYTGQEFNGTTGVITCTVADLEKPVSFECWLKGAAVGQEPIFGASLYNDNFLIYMKDGDKAQFRVSGTDEFGFSQTLDNAWHYLVFVVERDGTRHAYWDGVEKALDGTVVGVLSHPHTSTTILLGNSGNGVGAFTGILDEIRISQQALSSEYIKFAYYNINESDNDLIIGGEERGCAASGGVTIYTNPFFPPEYGVEYSVDQEFAWVLGAHFSVEQEFQWNVGDIPLNWYQVQGFCTFNPDLGCDKTGIGADDSMCRGLQGQRFQRIVAGRGVADACEKMKQQFLSRPIKWQIATIKRYSRPVYTDEETTPSSCDRLIEESWCEIPECFDFCLTVDAYDKIGVITDAKIVFIHTCSRFCSIAVGGAADARIAPLHYTASGGVALGGSASVTSSAWRWIPAETPPALIVSGDSSIKSSHWEMIADGGPIVSGSAAASSPSWRYAASGVVYIMPDGASVRVWKSYRFASTGIGVYLTGSSDAVGGNWHYYHIADGGVEVGGESENYPNPRRYMPTGGLLVGGSSFCTSPHYAYAATGSIVLASLYEAGVALAATGGVSVGGEADCRMSKHHESSGGVEVGGHASWTSPAHHYTASGLVIVTGEAEYSSNMLGTFEVLIGVVTDVVDTGALDIGEPPVELPVYPLAVVKTNAGYDVSFQIELRHNLADSNALADFLVRSHYTIPDRIFLFYDNTKDLWQSNIHYGSSLGTSEYWSLLFELGVTDNVADSELGQYVWKFNMLIQQKVNNIIKRTRLATVFDPAKAVLQTGTLFFPFFYNAQTGWFTSPASAANLFFIYEDGIGLFKNSYWKTFPELNFYISEKPVEGWMSECLLTDFKPTANFSSHSEGTTGSTNVTGQKSSVVPWATTSTTTSSTAWTGTTAASIFGERTSTTNVATTVKAPTAPPATPSPYEQITRKKPTGIAPPPQIYARKQEKPPRIFNK